MKLTPDQEPGEKTTAHCGLKACPLPRHEAIPTRRKNGRPPRKARCKWHLHAWTRTTIHAVTCQIGNHMPLFHRYYDLQSQERLVLYTDQYRPEPLPAEYQAYERVPGEDWFAYRIRFTEQLDTLVLNSQSYKVAS